MRLPDAVYDKVDQARIEVFEAPRSITQFWNERRGSRELRFYCGWYWVRMGDTENEDLNGPFRTRAAAYRDAFNRLQLRWAV